MVSFFIGILNPHLHCRILFFFKRLGFLQFLLRHFNLRFFLRNHIFQFRYPLLNLGQISVQLFYIGFQITLHCFQLVHHRLYIRNVRLYLLFFFLRLSDRIFFFFNALL